MTFKSVFFSFLFLLTAASFAQGQAFKPFKTLWQVANPDTIRINVGSADVDFDYTWTLTTDNSVQITGNHTGDVIFETPFSQEGEYELAISGTLFSFFNYPKDKLLDVTQWGAIQWRSMRFMFSNWPGESFSATDTLDLSMVIDMREMFKNATNFNDDLNHWNVSNITNMQGLFDNARSFNGDISSWNTANVRDMGQMFRNARSFNQAIGNWQTGKVTTLFRTFENADSLNQDLNSWDVSKVGNFANAFNSTDSFNGDIRSWDTSSGFNFSFMFRNAPKFNQDIGNWNTHKSQEFRGTFRDTDAFNQDISRWDVSNCTTFRDMLMNAKGFNQSLGKWKIRPGASFRDTFSQATAFSCENWSNTLIEWNHFNPNLENLSVGNPPNVTYDSLAAIARDSLIARGWVTGGTEVSGLCSSSRILSCENDVKITNDTIRSVLVARAGISINLDSVVVTEGAYVELLAPAINLSPVVEVNQKSIVAIKPDDGCPIMASSTASQENLENE